MTHMSDIVWGRQIPITRGVAAIVCIVIQARLGLLFLPLHTSNGLLSMLAWLLVIGINVGVWNLVGRPTVQGRPVHFWLIAQLRYFLIEPRFLVGYCQRVREPRHQRAELQSWSPE